MRDPYKTRQKELIEHSIKNCKNEFTIKELFTRLNEKDQTIGLTTVYRVVNKLAKDGILSKNMGSDGLSRYRIIKKCNHVGHCLLKCESCGNLTHTDCNELEVLSKHFKNKHHFEIDQTDITIYGICGKCKV
ncbi:transcriptional repressor [Candidatus Saccharibacteria bacterium]|nr:transcriptional repressor [Candidatus Saccharibacteria bacterium]